MLSSILRQTWIGGLLLHKKTSAIWSIKESCFESGTEYIQLMHARQN